MRVKKYFLDYSSKASLIIVNICCVLFIFPLEVKAQCRCSKDFIQTNIKALKDSEPNVREKAANNLGNCKDDKDAIIALLDVLGDPSESVHITAINSITYSFFDKSLLDEIITEKMKNVILSHKDSYIKWEMCKVIGRIGNESFVPVLLDVIKNDDNENTKQNAADALAKIANDSLIPTLTELLKEKEAIISKSNFNGLVNDVDKFWDILIKKGYIDQNGVIQIISTKALMDNLFDLYTDKDILAYTNEKQIKEIIDLIIRTSSKAKNITMRAAIVRVLGQLGNKSVIPVLTEILEKPNSPLKEEAIDALLKLEDKQSLFPKLIKLLKDESQDVRKKVALELGEFADQDKSILIDALIDVLKGIGSEYDTDYVRASAVITLGKIGDSSAVPALISVLENDKCLVARVATAKALGEIGYARAVPVLISASSQDSYPELKKTAKEALKKIGGEEAQATLAKIPKTTEDKLKEAQETFPDSFQIPDYYKALYNSDPFIRAAAADRIIGYKYTQVYFGPDPDKRVMARLAELFKDPHPIVKAEASYAYLEWRNLGEQDVALNAVQTLAELTDSNDKYIRNLVFRGLSSALLFGYATTPTPKYQDVIADNIINFFFKKIKETQDNEILQGIRSDLRELVYWYGNERVLKFILEDCKTHYDDYGHQIYDIIEKYPRKQSIPFLKERLQKVNESSERKEIKKCLIKLGEEVYKDGDYSLPNTTVMNFWRAIDRGDMTTAKSLLDKARFTEEAMDKVINDHKEALEHYSLQQIEYDFGEDIEKFDGEGEVCLQGERYGDKGDRCLKKAISRVFLFSPRDSPDQDVNFQYFFSLKDERRLIIEEINHVW